MNDIEFLLWFSVCVVVAWPLLVTLLVYVIQRSRITRIASYFLASLLSGYALSILTPVAIVFGAMLLGRQGEVAAIDAIFLTIPVVVVLTTVSAVFWSGRYGVTDSSPDPAGAQ